MIKKRWKQTCKWGFLRTDTILKGRTEKETFEALKKLSKH
jgi:hypothetical protein